MGLGHKYNVTDCFDTCVQFLEDTRSSEIACLSYGLAILYEQDELKELCESEIVMNAQDVFKSKYFLEADREILANILDMELFACSEIDVFEACMAWVKNASKQDELTKDVVQFELADLFYKIRFASMSIEDFCTLNLSYYDAFTSDEFRDITQMLVLPNYASNVFNKNPLSQRNKDATVTCDRMDANPVCLYQSSTMNAVEKTTFSTNKQVLLRQFTCANLCEFRDGIYHEVQSKLPANITIIEVSDPNSTHIPEVASKTLLNFKTSLEFKSVTVVSLPRPLLARAGYTYEIRVEQSPAGVYIPLIDGIHTNTVI